MIIQDLKLNRIKINIIYQSRIEWRIAKRNYKIKLMIQKMNLDIVMNSILNSKNNCSLTLKMLQQLNRFIKSNNKSIINLNKYNQGIQVNGEIYLELNLLKSSPVIWQQKQILNYQYPQFQQQQQEVDKQQILRQINDKHISIIIKPLCLRVIQYQFPLLQSFQKINERNICFPQKFKIRYYIFGQFLQTRWLTSYSNEIILQDLKSLNVKQNQLSKYQKDLHSCKIINIEHHLINSQVHILCINELHIIFAKTTIPFVNFLKERSQMIIRFQNKNTNLDFKIEFEIVCNYEETKGGSKSIKSILHKQCLRLSPQKATEIKVKMQIQDKNTEKRSKILNLNDKLQSQDLNLKLIKKLKDDEKQHKNKQYINRFKFENQRVIEIFTNNIQILEIIVQNDQPINKTVKLEFQKIQKINIDTKDLRFIISESQFKQVMLVYKGNKSKIQFSNLNLDQKNNLKLRPFEKVVVLFKIIFYKHNSNQYFFQKPMVLRILDSSYKILLTDYQIPNFIDLKVAISNKIQECLVKYKEIYFQFSRIPVLQQKINVSNGSIVKIIINPHKLINPEKMEIQVYPENISMKYKLAVNAFQIFMQCFSTKQENTIIFILINKITKKPQQLCIYNLKIDKKKVNIVKQLRISNDVNIYRFDVSEFVNFNTQYLVKSMMPNFIKILTDEIIYHEQKQQNRFIYLQLRQPISQIEVDIVLINTSIWETNFIKIKLQDLNF